MNRSPGDSVGGRAGGCSPSRQQSQDKTEDAGKAGLEKGRQRG
jgi:hypothetical protein